MTTPSNDTPSGAFEEPRVEQFGVRAQLEQLRGCGCGCGCGGEGGAGGGAGVAQTEPQAVRS